MSCGPRLQAGRARRRALMGAKALIDAAIVGGRWNWAPHYNTASPPRRMRATTTPTFASSHDIARQEVLRRDRKWTSAPDGT